MPIQDVAVLGGLSGGSEISGGGSGGTVSRPTEVRTQSTDTAWGWVDDVASDLLESLGRTAQGTINVATKLWASDFITDLFGGSPAQHDAPVQDMRDQNAIGGSPTASGSPALGGYLWLLAAAGVLGAVLLLRK